MADGFAQATGRPALVNLHAAAGTGNAMGNLTNTQSGHVPVIVTSGQQARRYTALNAMLTSVDAPKLAEPLVKWSHEPPRPADVPQALSRGILLAASAPAGPVYISLPLDDWDHDADLSALRHLKSRAVDGDPVVPEQALARLRDRLAAAKNPVMVAGPGIDNQAGWDGAVRLAEQLAMPVLVAPSPSRCPFPTRHPNFRGILPAGIPTVARHFEEHDLIVAFGAAIFRYHEFVEGDYLPEGAELWAVTSDPDEATRAPFGHILIGDPSDAISRLAGAMPRVGRDQVGPVRSHPPGQPVLLRLRRAGLGPARRHRPAARRPLPARAGAARRRRRPLHRQRPVDRRPVQDPSRLRRRAQLRVRRAEEVRPPERLDTLPDLTRAVRDALTSDQPRLIEITQRRLANT
jgi:benzoylformate decarboxylase